MTNFIKLVVTSGYKYVFNSNLASFNIQLTAQNVLVYFVHKFKYN